MNALGSLFAMALLSWRLDFVFLAAVLVFIAATRFVSAQLKSLTRRIQDSVGRANGAAVQALSLIRVVHAFSAEAFHRRIYSAFVDITMADSGRTKLIYSFFGPGLQLANAALVVGV